MTTEDSLAKVLVQANWRIEAAFRFESIARIRQNLRKDEQSQIFMMNLFYRFARTNFGRALIRFLFSKMPSALPVKRLSQTENLIAFHHPKPSHPFHVIIVPRKPVASLEALDPQDTVFLTDLLATVQGLVRENKLPAYRLIVNGGEYQEFPHLHFHLVSESQTFHSKK